jgi:hypothetical protein
MIKFRIMDKVTGLYSSGGYKPYFSKVGKLWDTKGQLISHLKLYRRGQYPGESTQVPVTWVVLEIQVEEKILSQTKALDLLK